MPANEDKTGMEESSAGKESEKKIQIKIEMRSEEIKAQIYLKEPLNEDFMNPDCPPQK